MGSLLSVASAAACLTAVLTGCMTDNGYGDWTRNAVMYDFAPLGDTAFVARLELYEYREHRGSGERDTRSWRSRYAVFHRRRETFDVAEDIPPGRPPLCRAISLAARTDG